MRIAVKIYDPFHRDVSWLTQEVIEDYASAKIKGGKAIDFCIAKWAKDNKERALLFGEILDDLPDFKQLQDQLLDEFGLEHFIGKPRPKEWHIVQLEAAIASERDNDVRAKLYKELREMRGWSMKPAEKSIEVNVNSAVSADSFDAKKMSLSEMERFMQSFLG